MEICPAIQDFLNPEDFYHLVPPFFIIFLPITRLSFFQNIYPTIRIYLIKIIFGRIAGRNSQSFLSRSAGKRFAPGGGNISPVWRRYQIVWNERFEQRLTGSPVWANLWASGSRSMLVRYIHDDTIHCACGRGGFKTRPYRRALTGMFAIYMRIL
jgi:hypothetical protein